MSQFATAEQKAIQEKAREEAYSLPLEDLNPARPDMFSQDAMWPFFERLRQEAPVHYTADSFYGPYWSITKFDDIVAIDTDHHRFSSEPGITLSPKDINIDGDVEGESNRRMFIAMDPPKHDEQRKTVAPALSPVNLATLEPLIRERSEQILDQLPIGEPFNWVEKVSKELTGMTLATLFGIPQEDRHKLLNWADVIMAFPGEDLMKSFEDRQKAFRKFSMYALAQWEERRKSEPRNDLISMLAHGEATRGMDKIELLGNIFLLTFGGNDTTRNTLSGSVYALNRFPDQFDKLRNDPSLVNGMVSETIRWQTPLAHMIRRAKCDVEFRGQQIKEGDTVVMWYLSGNRDEDVIPNADDYIIDRPRVRHHIAFGAGIHRCIGNRLAELQLKIVWEEILKRFPEVIVLDEPIRTRSVFLKGYDSVNVMIPKKQSA